MKQHILLGGVVVVSIVGIGFIVFGNSTVETKPTQEAQTVELTELEKLTEDIYNSSEFQNEVRLRAEARAMYQMSLAKQDEAVKLSEDALASYQMANTLENDWKLTQKLPDNIE